MTPYQTIQCAASIEWIERKSRFIGHAQPVASQAEADAFIAQIRAQHRTASHNVYAYIVRENQYQRYSDDGEPKGTAGMPVMNVLLKNQVTDVAVVVTRYFGGILLGAGGLVRAYGTSAAKALAAAKIITMQPCAVAKVTCSYSAYGQLAALIPECGGVLDDIQFADQVTLCLHIPPEKVALLKRQLADATAGQVQLVIQEEKYFIFEK